MIARLTMVSHLFVKKNRSLVFHCAAEPEKSQFLAPPSQCRRATAPPSAPAVNLFLSLMFGMTPGVGAGAGAPLGVIPFAFC